MQDTTPHETETDGTVCAVDSSSSCDAPFLLRCDMPSCKRQHKKQGHFLCLIACVCVCKLKGVPLSNNYTSLCVGCVGSVHRCFSRQRVPACSCWVRMVLLLQGRSVFKSRSQDAQEQCRRNKETERWALIWRVQQPEKIASKEEHIF